ncbi:MAG: glutathione S-transferase family protein [Alphaproteobacteria bacterium]|nr:glutathione S-transferase family protein [Alphaproteobacteria bacterium]
MILIGQYDSPFVRRVGIALTLYGLPFEHRPWSTFSEADKIRPYSPLVRVPVLVLVDGMALVDSPTILDHLDGLMPEACRLLPTSGHGRTRELRICALATGLADKAVSLFYEHRLHETVSPAWSQRCRTQIEGTAALLESETAKRAEPYWHGPTLGHADIAVAVALRFIADVHPGLIDDTNHPALHADLTRAETMPVFRMISQPFAPPA